MIRGSKCPDSCNEIPAQQSVNVNFFLDKLLCVRRTEDSILNSIRPPEDGKKCEDLFDTEYKICGRGDASHEICIPSADPCPIDRLYIGPEEGIDPTWTEPPVRLDEE